MKKSKFLILFAGIIIIAIIFAFISYICEANSLEICVASDFEMNISMETQDKLYDTIEIFDDSYILTNKYAYDLPLDNRGNPLVNMSYSGTFYIESIAENYLIITLKYDGMHSFKLDEHVLDQLVFLNDETKCAEVLFETEKGNRILYGNMNFVIIYNYKENIVQYISVSDGKAFKESSLSLRENYSYLFEIRNDKNSIEIYGHSIINNFDFFNTGLYEHSLSIPINQ